MSIKKRFQSLFKIGFQLPQKRSCLGCLQAAERVAMGRSLYTVCHLCRCTWLRAETVEGLPGSEVTPAMLGPEPPKLNSTARARFGLLFRATSLWIGVHYSSFDKRFCINVLPCITFWITLPGGHIPFN